MNWLKLKLIQWIMPKKREEILHAVEWDENDARVLMDFLKANHTGQKLDRFLSYEGNAMADIAIMAAQNRTLEGGKAVGYRQCHGRIAWLASPQSISKKEAKTESRSLLERIRL